MLSTLYQRNGIWHIHYRQDGKRVRRTLKTRDRAAAKIIQAEIDHQLTLGEYGFKPAISCSIVRFEDTYWPYAESHKRPRSVVMEQRVWRVFLASAKVTHLENITPAHIERWKAEGLGRGIQPRSANDYLGHLKAMLNWAVNADLLEVNPAAKVKALKIDQTPPRWLSKDEAARVLAVAAETDQDIHRVFALGLLAGLRRGEIVNAKWGWFDFDRLPLPVITVQSDENFKLKGRRSRTIPLQSSLASLLGPHRKPAGYLLNGQDGVGELNYRYNVERPFKRVCDQARVPWCTPHTLRHTFASHLVMAGVSLYKVSQWLGHRNITTTQIYAHLAPQDDEIERLGL